MINNRHAYLAAVLLLSIGSCSQLVESEYLDKSPNGDKVIVKATFGDSAETRTSFQGTDYKVIYWTPGDEINLFYGSMTKSRFTSTMTEASASASFEGSLSAATGSSEQGVTAQTFWGVYPYDEDNECDGEGVTLKIKGFQTSSPNSFGKGMNPSVANSPGLSLSFYNVGGWFVFSVTESGITSVSFSGNAGEDIAGKVRVTMDSSGKPVSEVVEGEGLKTITVTPEEGDAFLPNTEYCFTIIPQTLAEGFTFTMYKGNQVAVRNSSKSLSFERSYFTRRTGLDNGLTWQVLDADTEFNEDAFITYVANHESWFLGGDQYVNDTYFTGATGTRFEMKFQIPSYTSMSEVLLAPEFGNSHPGLFKVTRNRIFYQIVTKDDQIDTDLTSNNIDGTSVIVLSASCNGSQVTATVNGNEETLSLALSSFGLSYLFSSYGHDYDEGHYSAYAAGVPDGAKLYYVKIWNGDDLVYFGHAASATCPYSSNIEYCWYEEISQTYTFARELTMPSNADPGYGNTSNATVRQPFGGGVDVSVPVTGITLNKTTIAFSEAGETDQLTATVSPSNATISTVTWSTSDNTVATVRPDGTVTAVGDGAAVIIATAKDGSGVTAECKVTVGNIVFADENVKSICVANWDTNGDGELSYVEAAAVTGIGGKFSYSDIVTFNELQYFTNLIWLERYAFSNCTSLTSITLPDRLQILAGMVFYQCASLKRISLPKSVRILITQNTTNYVDEGAFYGSSIEEIEVYNNLLAQPSHYYKLNCYDVYGSQLSLSFLEFYPSDVYSSQETLKKVFVKKTEESNDIALGANAFTNFSSLEIVSLPDSVTEIGDAAFSGCSGLTSIAIPDAVTSIGGGAFSGCSGLTSITIPNGVTSISGDSFKNCYGLTSITIPDGVTSIGDYAFSGCSRLTSITIPDGVTSIGDNAFRDCRGLTSIAIPDGVTSINGAFSGCTGLTSITIPDGVTSINRAFSGCTGLTSIVIPDGVTSINGAFSGCTGLTNITIPDGVTSIGDYTFSGCTGLTSITIPDGVTSIGKEAFSGCSGLTSIAIPDGVISIGSSAFKNCNGLTSIMIPAGVTSIADAAFSGCSGLTSITMPDDVTSIGNYAFQNCSGLTNITIPAGVTNLGNGTFQNCSGLTGITIPAGVTSIGKEAFYSCRNLSFVKVLSSSVPTGGTDMFYQVSCNIYVLDDLVSQFKSATIWRNYASRIVGLSTFSE